jgi:endonuclease-8
MPEGDTIHRAAHTLHRALGGRVVTRFTSVFPQLTRVDADRPIAGRLVERVEAKGKHLLMSFSGDLVLRTHMRMHGSWHVYRPGERWQRPSHEMRIVIETDAIHAVAFSVPVAEFMVAAALERSTAVATLGPDLLAADFDETAAVARLEARADMDIADALLDQTALAGIGNVYKSETLFVARINPFTRVSAIPHETLIELVRVAAALMRANVTTAGSITTYGGMRRTTRRADPSARLWVYGRAGEPCRRCGTPISRRKQGPYARSTYWCERCQGVIA